MQDSDVYLLHRGRNLAIHLDQFVEPEAAKCVTDLINRLEAVLDATDSLLPALQPNQPPSEQVAIEREAFKQLFEASQLLTFWLDNVGRLSLHLDGTPPDDLKLKMILNPPGQRRQFLREDAIQALMDVRELLKAPQYG